MHSEHRTDNAISKKKKAFSFLQAFQNYTPYNYNINVFENLLKTGNKIKFCRKNKVLSFTSWKNTFIEVCSQPRKLEESFVINYSFREEMLNNTEKWLSNSQGVWGITEATISVKPHSLLTS